jgi:hypothetical protein
LLLCANARAVSADLASGVLACPSCGRGGFTRGLRAGAGDPGTGRGAPPAAAAARAGPVVIGRFGPAAALAPAPGS